MRRLNKALALSVYWLYLLLGKTRTSMLKNPRDTRASPVCQSTEHVIASLLHDGNRADYLYVLSEIF